MSVPRASTSESRAESAEEAIQLGARQMGEAAAMRRDLHATAGHMLGRLTARPIGGRRGGGGGVSRSLVMPPVSSVSCGMTRPPRLSCSPVPAKAREAMNLLHSCARQRGHQGP